MLQGCRGPVHAQFVENWVAYHYFDVANHRWEMSVLELYNKAQGNVTISEMVFGKTSNSISSYERAPVEVAHSTLYAHIHCTHLHTLCTHVMHCSFHILQALP